MEQMERNANSVGSSSDPGSSTALSPESGRVVSHSSDLCLCTCCTHAGNSMCKLFTYSVHTGSKNSLRTHVILPGDQIWVLYQSGADTVLAARVLMLKWIRVCYNILCWALDSSLQLNFLGNVIILGNQVNHAYFFSQKNESFLSVCTRYCQRKGLLFGALSLGSGFTKTPLSSIETISLQWFMLLCLPVCELAQIEGTHYCGQLVLLNS